MFRQTPVRVHVFLKGALAVQKKECVLSPVAVTTEVGVFHDDMLSWLWVFSSRFGSWFSLHFGVFFWRLHIVFWPFHFHTVAKDRISRSCL